MAVLDTDQDGAPLDPGGVTVLNSIALTPPGSNPTAFGAGWSQCDAIENGYSTRVQFSVAGDLDVVVANGGGQPNAVYINLDGLGRFGRRPSATDGFSSVRPFPFSFFHLKTHTHNALGRRGSFLHC